MSKEEFIKLAKEYGYSDEDIEEMIKIADESKLPYDLIVLIEKEVY